MKPIRTNDWFRPEVTTEDILAGNLSDLSEPILVACRDWVQFDEFVFREGLICSEVQRFKRSHLNWVFPSEKVLLILPGWDEDESTKYAVEQWVNQHDRYTVTLEVPLPRKFKVLLFALALACALAWVIYQQA